MSRSLITGIVVTILLFAGLAVFFYYSYIRVKGIPAVDAVPNDAVVIVSLQHAQKSWADLNQSEMWKDLRRNDAFTRLSAQIVSADSLISAVPELRDAVADNRSVVSFHVQGGDRLGMLFILETDGKMDAAAVMSKLAASGRCTLSQRVFEKDRVFDLLNESRFPVMSFSYTNELLICSPEGALVEESLRKIRYKLPNTTKGFEQARSMAEVGGDVSILVNYQHIPALTRLFTRTGYAQLFDYLRAFANWSMLDVKIEKEKLAISGISYTDDSLFQFLDLFKNQSPRDFTLGRYLPRTTSFMTHFTFSDYTRFNTDLNEYLQNRGKLDDYIRFADSLENRYGIELNEKLLPVMGDEAALCMLEPMQSDYEQKLFAVVKFTDPALAASVFAGYIAAFEKRGEKDSISTVYNGYPIERLRLGSFLKLYFGGVMEKIGSPYYTRLGDVFAFAPDAGTLRSVIDQYASGNVLDGDEAFTAFRSGTSGAANITFFVSPSRSFLLPHPFLNDEYFSVLNRYQYDFKKFEFLSVQYANTNNNAFFTNIHLRYTPSFKEETKMLWAVRLDTTFDVQPSIVYNQATGQNCILVQDAGNMLYYVSNSGSIVWKARIAGKVMGEVHEVDPQRNGSIHYLFNTDKQVFLIDENGVSLPGYPVKLPGTAAGALTMADPSGDSSISYFIPLTNSKIAGYKLGGRPLPGWNPLTTTEKVISPLYPFRIGSARYLSATGENGHLLVYSMKGERVKADPGASAMNGTWFMPAVDDTARMEWSLIDSAGNIRFVATDSTFAFTQVSSATPFFRPTYVHPAPGFGSLYLAGNNAGWMLADRKLSKIFARPVSDSTAMRPFFTRLANGETAVGWTDRQSMKSYLFDSRGGVYPTFPIGGSSVFTTGNLLMDGNNYLITGDTLNNLKLFRLK